MIELTVRDASVYEEIKRGFKDVKSICMVMGKSDRIVRLAIDNLINHKLVNVYKGDLIRTYTVNPIPFSVTTKRIAAKPRSISSVGMPRITIQAANIPFNLTDDQREAIAVYRGLKPQVKPPRTWYAKYIGVPKLYFLLFLQVKEPMVSELAKT